MKFKITRENSNYQLYVEDSVIEWSYVTCTMIDDEEIAILYLKKAAARYTSGYVVEEFDL